MKTKGRRQSKNVEEVVQAPIRLFKGDSFTDPQPYRASDDHPLFRKLGGNAIKPKRSK